MINIISTEDETFQNIEEKWHNRSSKSSLIDFFVTDKYKQHQTL